VLSEGGLLPQVGSAALWFSFTHASPLPYGDEYELTLVLTGHQPLPLTYLLSRHNEHRLPLSRLALHAVLPMAGYDFRYAVTAATVGPFLRRESLLLDRPIERLAFATAKDDVELRVSRIVLHVRDE
jgi:hypothetical protein